YGNIAPRTTLGRLVTLAYAFFGIPLTLVYLSSTGGILAKVAREVFSKALCCCLCSNCGYCCYDEKRMAEKERRMKRKRQQEELRKQQQAGIQEPYYVRSGSMTDAYQTPEKQSLGNSSLHMPDLDSVSASESRGSMHGLAILAPVLLCFSMMIIYILFGAAVLYRLEDWPLLDGIYFCFMSLSTIGFGDMMPGFRRDSTTTIWFCSIYIMSGMALTAMCFNVIHEEIVNRIKIVVEFKKTATMETTNDEPGTPTSLVFGSHQDNEINNMHVLKDYVNHELVPILTMDPNSAASSTTNLLKTSVALPLNNIPSAANAPASCPTLNALNSPLLDNLTPTTQSSSLDSSNGCNGNAHALKGVYTLAEEPELEAQETQIDRI
uniref:Potassium channel domain-containing protein n=1 Tax=Glossina brevipalpis TaxID=37001 RepID=A0A1A9WRE8_9MUSC